MGQLSFVHLTHLTRSGEKSIPQIEPVADMRAPQEWQALGAISRIGLVCTAGRLQQDTLIRKTHVKRRVELDGLGSTALQPATSIRAVP